MPKPTSIDPQIEPAPELEKRARRRFTTEYKLSIIQKANACKHGELGQLLREENLYSNQLAQWRREFEQGGLQGLSKSAPSPKAHKSPEQKRMEQLEKENARLKKQLAIKDDCIELQKKALKLIDTLEQESKD